MDVSSLLSISINFRGKGLECPRFPDEDDDDVTWGVLCGVVVVVEADMLDDRFRPLLLFVLRAPLDLVSCAEVEAMELGEPSEANAGEEKSVSTTPPPSSLLAPGDSPTLLLLPPPLPKLPTTKLLFSSE